jgi:hypothetical protein
MVVAQSFLLDQFPTGGAAWSLRRVKTGATRSIRVRESGSNTETDIGFLSSGELDTVALKNHVGANSGFVTTFYNQNGDSLHFTQSTAASQPRLVDAGVIERRNGKPSLFFDGSNDFMDVASSTASFNYLHQTGQSAIFLVNQVGTNTNPAAFIWILGNSQSSATTGFQILYDDVNLGRNDRIRLSVTRSITAQFTQDNLSNDNAFNAGSLNIFSCIIDNGNSTVGIRSSIYVNNGAAINNNVFSNTPSTINATSNLRIGRQVSTTSLTMLGYISEIVLYNSNQSSNRTGIQSNINTFYVIY